MHTRSQWIRWSLVLAIGGGVVGVVWLPPLVGESARSIVMHAFSGLCHQLPGRSLHVDGVPLAVCDRCLGIYSGVLLGVLTMPWVPSWARGMHRHAGLVIAAALVPLGIDWLGPVLGGWSNGPLSRAATGALFGVTAGLLVAYAITTAGRRSAETTAAPSEQSPRPSG